MGGYHVFNIGICDDEKGTCAELENMLYAFGEKQGITLEVSIWYTGENLCAFLKNETILDILFLDIELISTDGIKVGRFIRDELENLETVIIYISSKSNYAMSLFRIQPFDFLIKPLNQNMIDDVMERSVRIYEKKNHFLNTIQKHRAAIPKFVLRIFYIFTVRTKK